MLLIYFLSDFEIVPVSIKFTGKIFVLTFYVRSISVAKSTYFNFFVFFLLLSMSLLYSYCSTALTEGFPCVNTVNYVILLLGLRILIDRLP